MAEAARIAILDYGMGNLRSVEKALEHVGARAEISAERAAIEAAEGLILPGVGAFPQAMDRIRDRGLDRIVAERRAAGVPILGICLGMQLLFESSTELGGAEGLGLLAGEVRLIEAGGLKVPNIGWAPVAWERDSDLVEGIPSGTPFYLVHSYVAHPRAEDLLGSAEYGTRFACAVARDNVFGAQFHPEKSSSAGLRMLANFAAICSRAPSPV